MRRILLAAVVLGAVIAALCLSLPGAGPPSSAMPSREKVADAEPILAADASERPVVLEGRGRTAEAPDAASESYSLWVLVESASDGSRIGGARVEATLRDGSKVGGTTLANGLARLEGLRAVPSQVVASADGFAPDIPRWSHDFDKPVSRVLIQLRRATEKHIRVTELETGSPVADARLVLHPCVMVRMNRTPFTLDGALEAGATDGHGCATLRLRAGGSSLRASVLAIHAEGRRTTWWPVGERVAASKGRWELRVPAGGDIRGTIRDGRGKPIADVAVTACPGTRGFADTRDRMIAWPLNEQGGLFGGTSQVDGVGGWWSPLTARTGKDGRYRVPGIGLGQPYAVSARKTGYTPADATDLRGGREAGEIRWDPVLKAEGRLVVRVVDPDGKPIPGVYGSASSCSNKPVPGGGRTDARGILAFEGLDTGTYNVGLQPEAGPNTPRNQYGQAKYDNEKGWGLSVRQGETTEVVLVLPHGAHGDPPRGTRGRTRRVDIAGVVVDEGGRPLSDVVILDRTGAPLAVTDEHGRFTGSAHPRHGVTLGANGPYATDEVHEPPTDGSELRIVARPGRLVPIRVRILLPEGAPPPDSVRVTLDPFWRGGFGYTQPSPSGAIDVPWPAPHAREVLVERDMRPGGVRARVDAEGFLVLHREIQIEAGGGPVCDAWTLDRGEVARGRVADEDGRAVAGARVVVSGDAGNGKSTIVGRGGTSADGSFEVGGLGPRPWTYDVRADGYLPIHGPYFRLEGESRAPNVDPDRIVLTRGGRLRVLVVDAEGLARAEISVSLDLQAPESSGEDERPAPDDSAYGATDLDGTAVFLVAPGRWKVTLPSGWQGVPDLAAPLHADVTAGETAEVRFTLADE